MSANEMTYLATLTALLIAALIATIDPDALAAVLAVIVGAM